MFSRFTAQTTSSYKRILFQLFPYCQVKKKNHYRYRIFYRMDHRSKDAKRDYLPLVKKKWSVSRDGQFVVSEKTPLLFRTRGSKTSLSMPVADCGQLRRRTPSQMNKILRLVLVEPFVFLTPFFFLHSTFYFSAPFTLVSSFNFDSISSLSILFYSPFLIWFPFLF